MALVASIFPQWTLLAVMVHILFMGNFIYIFDKPYFCSYNCCTNYFFSIMLGTVFLFHFIATNDGPQKYKISFFYIVCGLENIASSVIFYLWVDPRTNQYYQLYLIVIWICFVFGLAFKVIYYRWFHPNITAREKAALSPEKRQAQNQSAMNGGKEQQNEGNRVKMRTSNFIKNLSGSIIHPEDAPAMENKVKLDDESRDRDSETAVKSALKFSKEEEEDQRTRENENDDDHERQ